MTATVSPVRLVSPASMRFGVWRSLSARLGDERASLADSQSSAIPRWSASSAPCLAEWRLERVLPVPVAVLSRAWWLVSLLGLMAVLASLAGWHSHEYAHEQTHALRMVASLVGVSLMCRLALRTYGRHASDHDRIAMSAAQVRVDRSRGGRTESHDFHPRWVRVEPLLHDRSLICLSGEGQRVVVGEFVPANERRQLAEELRWALRHLDD